MSVSSKLNFLFGVHKVLLRMTACLVTVISAKTEITFIQAVISRHYSVVITIMDLEVFIT